jgi:hypothetical protein
MIPSANGTRLVHLVSVVVLTAAVNACTSAIEARNPVTGDFEVVAVDAPPDALDHYPHEVYSGRDFYLFNGHWVYRDGDHWVAYRNEPDQLRERRLLYLPPERPRAQ